MNTQELQLAILEAKKKVRDCVHLCCDAREHLHLCYTKLEDAEDELAALEVME